MGEGIGARTPRPPRQARTRASWERVLEEGVALLEEEAGYAGLTIGALCERAGVTPPTIYARAGSKDGLLLAVYDRAMAHIDAVDGLHPEDPRWAGLDDDALVRGAVDEVARPWLARPALLRAIVHRAAVDPEVWRRGSLASRDLGGRFRRVVTREGARAGVGERRADGAFRLVYAALVQRTMYGPGFESDVKLDDAASLQLLGDAAVAYLNRREERA
jgi:AcrR family transcriptional regulator